MDARAMRRRLAETAQQLGITAEPDYDRREGWQWEWIDGPTVAAVEKALGPEVVGRVRLRRRSSPRAAALAAVVEALHGTEAETRLAGADTTTAPDARTGALAEALVAEAPEHTSDDVYWLRRRLRELGGPAALLHPYTGTAADEADPMAMTPLEHLTARYTRDFEARDAWRQHLHTAEDAASLARAALADDGAQRADRVAAVALLGELRAELERLELAALDRAVEAGATYTELGRAMGVAKQVAHSRHMRRAGGRPSRSSSQR